MRVMTSVALFARRPRIPVVFVRRVLEFCEIYFLEIFREIPSLHNLLVMYFFVMLMSDQKKKKKINLKLQ